MERVGLRVFVLFIILVYFKKWTTCSLPQKAAFNDIELVKDVEKFKTINKEVALEATKKNATTHMVSLGRIGLIGFI